MELVDESLWQETVARSSLPPLPVAPLQQRAASPQVDLDRPLGRPRLAPEAAQSTHDTTATQQVFQTVVDRAAHLLHAQVCVLDAQERVVVASQPRLIGRQWTQAKAKSATSIVRTAMTLQNGDFTLVAELRRDEATPPHVAQALIELLVSEERYRHSPTRPPLADARQFKDRFIYELLLRQDIREEDMLRQGQMLGIDLMQTRAVLLIDATTYILQRPAGDAGDTANAPMPDERLQRRVNAIITSVVDYFRLPNDNICAYIGGGEIVLLKASGTKDLRAWARESRPDRSDRPDLRNGSEIGERSDRAEKLREQPGASWANLTALKRAGEGLLSHLQRAIQSDITIGIGRYHPGVRGLARSYQDARAAVLLGRHFQGANRLHCLDGLGAAAFIGVSEEQTKIDLARHLLSPMDQDPELLETVRVFFAADCIPSTTAQRLIIHRNTLTYRLDKVTSLTGLDPRRFDDAIQIRLALLLRTLQNDSVHPGSQDVCADAQ